MDLCCYRDILPQLERCKGDPSDIVDLFALSAPQMKALYVTYCKGKHRSEDIYNENVEYLQVCVFVLNIMFLMNSGIER